ASGPPVALPARLTWRTTASQPYWVLATARFQVGGAKAQQFINFSAMPMSLLNTASRSCTPRTFTDNFTVGCPNVKYTFESLPPGYRVYPSNGVVSLDTTMGNPAPSLYTYASGRQAYSALFVNLSAQPFQASSRFAFNYYLSTTLGARNYFQVNFFIDTNGDGSPDLEVVYYASGGGTSPLYLDNTIYGRTLQHSASPISGFSNTANTWLKAVIGQVYTTGNVVGLALTAYVAPGGGTSSTTVRWDNVYVSCPLPSYISSYTRGSEFTMVYIDQMYSPSTTPSLATEADAIGANNNPATDFGIAAAIYDVTRWAASIPAAGFTFSVKGLYNVYTTGTEANNELGYVSVGVDRNNDGTIDVEYIFYRYNTSVTYSGVIVSTLVSPGTVVCTVGGNGACTPSDPRFIVYRLGGMDRGSSYTWSGSLPPNESGTVRRIALAITDGSYYASGVTGDVFIWWDDLSFTYIDCTPLPPEWSVSGDTYYRQLVPGAVVYAGSFAGDGGFYLFDSGLNPILGGRRQGTGYYARCGGGEVYLGSFPSGYWLDLRPLSQLWEVIVRDSTGVIVARYGCRPAGTPSYAGFTGASTWEFRAYG
ncbi:MAG: hypothetical protein ABWK01_10000, partial [Infirmifilum sp.]